MKTNYESVYGDSLFRGFSYDQMMLALRGIDFTINSGLNIEDPYVLNKLLRIQKFRGATGTVSISPDSNDRSNFVLSIFSLVYNPDSPSHGDTEIGNYSLSSTQRFSFKKDITWPDGTKNVPKDMIEFNYRCEYEQDADHFETGSWVFRSINILFTVFAVSLVFISYKNLKLMRLEDLTEKKLIKFDDILMYILVILEMFQYLVLAPDIRFKNTNISQISNYLSGGLVDILTVYGDEYWISVYLLISLFLIFFYFVCCDLFIKLRHFSDDSLGLSLIFFSNFVTIPMIMVCLNVFKCT